MASSKSILRRYRTKPTVRPRVTMHANGQVTVSGLNYQDARSMFTAAWLWNDQEEKEARSENESRENLDYHARERWILDALKVEMDARIQETHGPRPIPTLKERLQENRKLNDIIDRAIAAGLAQAYRAGRGER
jgi:hypothetical protein